MKLQHKLSHFLKADYATGTQWSSLMGTITSCQDLTPLGRVMARDLQIHLNHHWKNRQNPHVKIPITSANKLSLQWWTNQDNVMCGKLITTSQAYGRDVDRREYSRSRRQFKTTKQHRNTRVLYEMGFQNCSATHKCLGTDRSTKSSTLLGTSGHKSKHSSSRRQHYLPKLSKQVKRLQKPSNASLMSRNTSLVSSKRNNTQSSSHQRETKRPQRLFVTQRHDNSNRMVNSPNHHSQDSSHLGRTSSNRSVCHQVEQEIPSVHLTSVRSSSSDNRCSQCRLDRLHCLCLSSPSYNHTSAQSSGTLRLPDLSSGSQLAQNDLVSQAAELTSGLSQENSMHPKVITTAQDSHIPSESRIHELTRVQVIQSCLEARGFSKPSATAISEKNRESSEHCYERYWNRYLHWCKEKSVHPIFTTVTVLADFLNEIVLSQTVVPTTLDGIKSCILITLKFCTGIDLTLNSELCAITAKYHKDCPAEVFKVPSWNLVLVLECLCKPPFEPITQATFKMLTFKCVFLVAVACSCRLSELHALAFDKLSHDKNWSVVYLSPRSDFIAKNQTSRAVTHQREFKLKALVKPAHKTNFAPDSPEAAVYNRNKLLCPVRALRFYLARTVHRRSHAASLFVSLQPNHRKDITKQSVANWVRRTIKLCYALVGDNPQNLGRASVHEIRSLTSSLKFERNLSLDSIMKSCVWKSGNTFTRFYLKNVALMSQDLYKLPPVCMSQSKLS